MNTITSEACINTKEFKLNIEDEEQQDFNEIREKSLRSLLNLLHNIFPTLNFNRISITTNIDEEDIPLYTELDTISEDYRTTNLKVDNLKRLNIIASMKPDWNGYGADVFDNEIIMKAVKIIKNLHTQPEVFPTGRSTIQIEYDNKNDYLEFEIYKDKITMYRESQDEEPHEAIVNDMDINELVERFYSIG